MKGRNCRTKRLNFEAGEIKLVEEQYRKAREREEKENKKLESGGKDNAM